MASEELGLSEELVRRLSASGETSLEESAMAVVDSLYLLHSLLTINPFSKLNLPNTKISKDFSFVFVERIAIAFVSDTTLP